MGAAAFGPADGCVDADTGLREHVVEFERLGEHHRAVGHR
jgi:hypothetical protein